MQNDTIFEVGTTAIRFGKGASKEAGMELADRGLRRVMVLVDPAIREIPTIQELLQTLDDEKIAFDLFDAIDIEPTDRSFLEAADFAKQGNYEGFLAIGGGSTIDTAKAANLFSTYPADFLDYVNPPLGKGLAPAGPLKPLIAMPTTAGTGSECTAAAIFGFADKPLKTGISHPYLKPSLGILDPDLTITLPKAVAASCGLDVLSHALESLTAISYDTRPRPNRPSQRPVYQGCNPVSDVWSLEALKKVAQYLPRFVRDVEDEEARSQMMLAATLAGIGFGNAGVHLPHAMSYPVAGMVRDWFPPGYPSEKPMVPHGIAVIINAPAAFRFTAYASPDRHLRGAQALGIQGNRLTPQTVGSVLSEWLLNFMQELHLPTRLSELGYQKEDIPQLVEGTLAQKRLTALAPRPVHTEALTQIFEESL